MADVRMPQLGESVTEGTLGKWLKQVGDKVEKYEPLVEVITDKVNAEIPSDMDGILTEIVVQEGVTVSVGTKIAVITEAGESTGGQASPNAPTAADSQPVVQVQNAQPAEMRTTVSDGARARYSPAVMRLIQENNVDPTQLQGTGLGGRITRKDVLRFLESGGTAGIPRMPEATQTQAADQKMGQTQLQAQIQAVAEQVSPNLSIAASAGTVNAPMMAQTNAGVAKQTPQDEDTVLPLTPVRRTIARRMLESKHQAPHAWTMVEVDVTSLVKFRSKVKDSFKKSEGVDLTYLPFFIKAVTESLKEFPMLNSTWAEDSIIVKRAINISIAIATDDALVVPVIHHADRLSITGIAHAMNELVAKAKAGKLTIDDMQGGTFTVNNTGAFGSILSAPIINSPQAAILSMESIVKRPVVLENDAIAIRSMVNLCLSLDHRVLDGLVCGRFLQSVKRRLQEYGDHTIL